MMKPSDRTLGMGRGGNNESPIVAQDLEPGCDVGGVVLTRRQGQAKVRAEKDGPEFCNKLLAGISGVTMALAA